MRVSTSYNKQRIAIQQLRDIYSGSKIWKAKSADITDKVLKVYSSLDTCPRHVRSYVQGYQACLFEELWQEMEFCYLIDNVWHSTHKTSDKPRVPAESMSGRECCFMWKGTEKPYTTIDTVK